MQTQIEINKRNVDPNLLLKLESMWSVLTDKPNGVFEIQSSTGEETPIRVDRQDNVMRILSSSTSHGRGGQWVSIPIYVWVVCRYNVLNTDSNYLEQLCSRNDCAPFPFVLPADQMKYNEDQFNRGIKQWIFPVTFYNPTRTVEVNIYLVGQDQRGNMCFIMSRKENNQTYLRLVKRMRNTNDLITYMIDTARKDIVPQFSSVKDPIANTLLNQVEFNWSSLIRAVLNKSLPFTLGPIATNYFDQIALQKEIQGEIDAEEAQSLLGNASIVSIRMQ